MVLYSCRKDHSEAEVQDAPEISFSVKNARSYFYNTLRKAQEAKAKVSTLQKKDKIYPYWYYAYEATTPKYSFVEVPITGDETRSYTARASSDQLASATENLQVLNGSLRRLVMYKDKNGVIGEHIITYIPDLAYLKKHHNDISHNQINKLDKDYSGYLRYSSIDGNYLFMLRIKNGRTIGKHSANKSKAGKNKKVAGTSTLEEICDVIHWVEWEQECTSYYPDGPEEPGEEICGEWYIVDEWDEVIDCYVDCSDPANFYDAECYEEEDPTPPPTLDCAGVLGGSAINSPQCGCIGGTTGLIDCNLSKIMGNTNLTSAQKTALNLVIDNLLSDCMQAYIFNNLDGAPNIDFYIDASIPAYAAYDPSLNKISFKDESQINAQNLMEEMFHAYQNNVAYPGGTAQYTTTGRANVEFEEEVYQDILEKTSLLGGSDAINDDGYRNFILGLISPNDSFPNSYNSGIYDGYLNLWTSQNQGQNGYPSNMTILNTLSPIAFNSLLNNPCN
jgi:hypothetical protein